MSEAHQKIENVCVIVEKRAGRHIRIELGATLRVDGLIEIIFAVVHCVSTHTNEFGGKTNVICATHFGPSKKNLHIVSDENPKENERRAYVMEDLVL